ncbi:MAG: polyphenol oxidase family protein [Acidobacteriota bacterium]|nr:polyphenol oxidase family protein [Acidobacteriota bacterium]MDE3263366.1 polyphenol oxidase family protein [Acidobacteriota bacterium]
MAAASYSRRNVALAVYRRPPVWAAFLGVAPQGGKAGPEDALSVLASQVPAAAAVAPAWLRQRHGTDVLRATEPGRTGDGDGLIVSESGVAATVFVADCVPVLIAAGDSVAAVHAGWRGLASGVLASAVHELSHDSFRDGTSAEAWIGPAIGPCCYEVGEDVAVQVESRSGADVVTRRPDRKPHLDLPLAASRQLAGLGVGRISTVERCVRCSPEWWSYRRDGARAGRNYGFIWRGERY